MGIGNGSLLPCKLRYGKNVLRDLLHDWWRQEEEQWKAVIWGKEEDMGYCGLLRIYIQGNFAWLRTSKDSLALRIRKTQQGLRKTEFQQKGSELCRMCTLKDFYLTIFSSYCFSQLKTLMIILPFIFLALLHNHYIQDSFCHNKLLQLGFILCLFSVLLWISTETLERR